MILDSLEHASLYTNLAPGFDLAFKYLLSDEARTAKEDRYELDGDRVVALVQTYTTKPVEEGFWEAHRKYADIQLIDQGRERMSWAPLDTLKETQPYDASKDVAFYAGPVGPLFTVNPGWFAIFFPHDPHMPSRTVDGPEHVRKICMKVQVGE